MTHFQTTIDTVVKRPYVTQQNSRQPVVAKVVVLDKDLPSH